MRIALAAVTAVALLSAPAVAAPYVDLGEFATFSTPLTVDGPANAGVGSAFAIGINGTNALGTEEFEAVNGVTSSIGMGLTLTAQVGAANVGQWFSSDYDRTGISDPASAPGIDTGTLTFTFGSTTNVQIGTLGGTTQAILIQGLLAVDDGAGFYDASVPGSWSFSGTFNSETGDGLGSLVVSVPPDNNVVVSEPGLLALAGAGLIGLAVARRRA